MNTRIKTVADPAAYSCRDLFRDYKNLYTFMGTEDEPKYFEKHIELDGTPSGPPDISSGTNFYGGYARLNPQEDLAESLAASLLEPDLARQVFPEKVGFLENHAF